MNQGNRTQVGSVARPADIDAQIGRLARRGAFEKSGVPAIQEALKAGRTATILEGDTIVRLHPDGTKEVVKKLEPSARIS